eukprot:5176278-Pyramimonas_sp.AAC.1
MLGLEHDRHTNPERRRGNLSTDLNWATGIGDAETIDSNDTAPRACCAALRCACRKVTFNGAHQRT